MQENQKLHLCEGGELSESRVMTPAQTDSAVHLAMRSRQWSLAAVLLALAHVAHALTAESSAPEQIFVTARMPDYKVTHEDVRPPPCSGLMPRAMRELPSCPRG